MRSRRFLARYGVAAAGLVILVAGVLVWVAARMQGPPSFGWYVYSPLATRTRYADYLPPGPWAGHEMIGLVMAAIGLSTLSAGVGYRLGVRAGGRRETDV